MEGSTDTTPCLSVAAGDRAVGPVVAGNVAAGDRAAGPVVMVPSIS